MRTLATLAAIAAAIIYASPAFAEDEPDKLETEVYGTLLPFFENVGTSGATPNLGFVSQTTLVSNDQHTGINHERRWRMTSGTSNIGFRGHYTIAPDLFSLIWQVESPAPIDGEGPSNWANRNSHVGFSGLWGSLVYGNWDTPMRWATVTSVNPIKGGYTGDMTAIIGTPGFGIPAWNADQTLRALFQIGVNPVGFFRHEPNSIQYWSPMLAGFSLRVMYSADEHRTATLDQVGLDPYVVSGSIGWDNDFMDWSRSVAIRVRASAEMHKDIFGMGPIGGAGPFENRRSSQDVGYLGLLSLTFNRDTEYATRVVATGDYLTYLTNVDAGVLGIINEYSRPAFYTLIHQKLFGSHNLWAAYGQALEGTCAITGNLPCTTTGIGASYYSGGYMYMFSKSVGIYALGYLLANDVSARYTPFPVLELNSNSVAGLPNLAGTSPGSDVMGVGVGFYYSFSAKILGDKEEAPKVKEEPPPAAKEEQAAEGNADTAADEEPAEEADEEADDRQPNEEADEKADKEADEEDDEGVVLEEKENE